MKTLTGVWKVVIRPFRFIFRSDWIPVVALIVVLVILWVAASKTELEKKTCIAEYEALRTDYSEDARELERLRSLYALAVEFDLSPIVVEAFYAEAKKVVNREDDWKTWRFIQSPEFLTYLMCSIIKVESNGDRFAVGDDGRAVGLTQIWLTTARDYEPDVARDQLFNPVVQARIATRHFIRLLERYDGNHARAVISWNRGEGRVDQLLAQGLSPENGYVYKVYKAALVRNSNFE